MAHDVFISYSSKDKPVADATCAAVGGHKYTVVLLNSSGTPVVVPLDLTLVAGGFKHNGQIGGVAVDFSDHCTDTAIDGLPVAVFRGTSQQGAAVAEWVFAPALDGNPAMYEVYDDGKVPNSPTAGNSGVAFAVQ